MVGLGLALGFAFISAWGLGGVFSIRSSTSSSRLRAGVFVMQKVTLLDELPVDLNRGIGRIVSAFALLEHNLDLSVSALTGLGHKERRIALFKERTESRLSTCKLLFEVHGLKVSIPEGLTVKKLKMVREARNLFAHGVWTKTQFGYAVIQTAGSWDHESGLGSRKLKPAAVTTDATALAAVLAEVVSLRKGAETLRERVDAALRASPRIAR